MGVSSRGASRTVQCTQVSQVLDQCSHPDVIVADDDIRERTSEVRIEIDDGPTSRVAVVPAWEAMTDGIGCRRTLTGDGTSLKLPPLI